jgi:hypothetical protein
MDTLRVLERERERERGKVVVFVKGNGRSQIDEGLS